MIPKLCNSINADLEYLKDSITEGPVNFNLEHPSYCYIIERRLLTINDLCVKICGQLVLNDPINHPAALFFPQIKCFISKINSIRNLFEGKSHINFPGEFHDNRTTKICMYKREFDLTIPIVEKIKRALVDIEMACFPSTIEMLLLMDSNSRISQ
jgi:hypothetical protein